MPYNLKFYKTESATARCLAGAGAETSYTASSQSIIAQRDVDRKALGWAQAAAQSMLECTIPGPAGFMEVAPLSNYDTEGDKGGSYPTAAYVITNTGTDDLDWSVTLGAGWLTASPTSGHLYVGESRTITFGVDDTALAAGATYNTTMDLVNETTGQTVSYIAQVLVFPLPLVSAAYASELGTATLIGFSEYTTPSSPPKKYRVQTFSGNISTRGYGAAGCVNPTAFGYTDAAPTGDTRYNALTGALSQTQWNRSGNYLSSGGTSGCAVDPSTIFNQGLFGAGSTLDTAQASSVTTAPTFQSATFPGCPVCNAVGGFSNRRAGTMSRTLSEEDTEDDAIVRAAKTAGTSNQAYRELRGAGDFTFQFREVEITLDFTGLYVGQSYQATIDLNTENYGGGGSVVTQRTYNFTAAAATHQIVDTLSAADGKQVTASNPAVIRVP